jgi:hypothetical protein
MSGRRLIPPLKGEGDRAQRGGGVSAYPDTLTHLRQPYGLPPPLEGENLL